MIDKISIQRVNLLHPKLRNEASEILQQASQALKGKAMLRFTQTLRTHDEQERLYAQGRTTLGHIVTWAKGGESYHNYGLAVDICLIIDGKDASWDTLRDYDKDGIADWMEVVKIFEGKGWEWGGRWAKPKTDMPHFQKTFGLSIGELKLLKHNTLGNYINI